MRWVQMLRLRLRALLRPADADRELHDEIEQHLAYLTLEHIAAGMSPDQAREAALRDFGGVTRTAEACRDARGITPLANLVQDFRYGVRLLRRGPGFTAAAILTVAIGVGATTAMFSVVYGILLQPLPFGSPEDLVLVWTTAPSHGIPRAFVGAANARDWQAQTNVFEDLALVRTVGNFNLVGEGEPERLQGARVSANLFSVLRTPPLIGRTFLDEEDDIGKDHVVVLSHGLWRRRFGGDRGCIGRSILLNGAPHTVVGVMGPEFTHPGRDFELWVPLTINPDDFNTRMNYAFVVVARLRRGATIDQARAELNVVAARLARQYPDTNRGIGADVAPMLNDTVADVRTPLYVLLGAVTAMLLTGCANLANLLLARALARQREMAVRSALGASRARLVAQSVGELVPMLLAGGTLGIVTAAWILRALVPLFPTDVPRVEGISISLPVLAFTLGTLGAIALLTGIWPALEAVRHGLSGSVADLSRGSTGGLRRTRMRDMLVVAQIAVTLVLLVGATLLMRSFAEVTQVDPGFTTDRVLSAHLAIPRSKYPSDPKVAEFCGRVLDRVRSLPDVLSAAMVNRLPLGGGVQAIGIEFKGVDPQVGQVLTIDSRTVTPDYFRTMAIPLAGRDFAETDDEDAPPVGIIDQRLAESVWPGVDPIGRSFRISFPGQPWLTIVGVAGHIRHARLDEDSRPQVYWSYRQRAQDRMALVVKTRGEPAALGRSIASVIRSVDYEQPVYDVRTLDAVRDRSVAGRWLQTMLLGVFAFIALLLASVGVYGVIAYGVGQRLREFGIRMALGARRRDIIALVLRRAAVLFAVGTCLGLTLAAAGVQVLGSLLFNVWPFDPMSFAAATLVLLVVGFVACYVPARRAGRVDSAVALRAE